MVSVDVRTRTSADVRTIEPAAFFEDELPRLFAERADLAVPGSRELGLRPFAFSVDGQSWTLTFDGSKIAVASGTEAATAVVALDASGFSDVVNDVRTPIGFFTGGDLDMPKGGLQDFLDWWVILRSLIDGRPAYTTGSVDLGDERAPADLHRAFGPDADPVELGQRLAQTGYLHISGVFDAGEMAAVSADMDDAMDTYAPDDGRSWWARTHAGEERLVRMQYFHEQSPAARGLLGDERLRRLTEITDDGHLLGKPGENNNIVEALVKPIGVIEGISDVPWHKDCSLGSHSYRCCSMTLGVSVTGADADSGQLRVVAGSHRALIQPAFVRRNLDLPMVDLPTNTGDVTIHLSCTLHMSQPPVTRERRVLYTDFSLPDRDPGLVVSEQKLKRIREAASKTVSQPPGHRG